MNQNNFKKIISDKPSSWKEKAEDRLNKPWLREYSSQIARRILAIINDGDKELSQAILAKSIGVERQQINKIIKGQENLTLESIYKLSKALDFELITFPPYRYNYRNIGKRTAEPIMGKIIRAGEFSTEIISSARNLTAI